MHTSVDVLGIPTHVYALCPPHLLVCVSLASSENMHFFAVRPAQNTNLQWRLGWCRTAQPQRNVEPWTAAWCHKLEFAGLKQSKFAFPLVNYLLSLYDVYYSKFACNFENKFQWQFVCVRLKGSTTVSCGRWALSGEVQKGTGLTSREEGTGQKMS